MSNIYNLEPPTKGKVTLKTTIGDLDIELWPKEAPKAVRNFVQLCLEGAYDGCIFHRVIKDFMAQTGDPTGSGQGGESVYGAPFRDEFHSRLRFNHRGLVACANANEPNTNGSQFFISLDKCEWLDRKNTIFGKIVGDTVYNMLRLNELEVDEETDRPADPPVITSVDVLWNPFEDIVPRTTPQERVAQQQFVKAEETRKEKKSRKRNLALLSFGEQAEEEEADLAAAGAAAKIRSAHEVLKGDAKLLAPEDTPEEILREQEARAAALTAVQDRLKGAAGKRGRDEGSDSDGEGREQRKPRSGAAAVVAERVRAAADKASSARAAREAAEAAGGGEAARARSRSRSPSRSPRSRQAPHSSRSRSRSQERRARSRSSDSSGSGSDRDGRRRPSKAAGAASAAAAAAGGKQYERTGRVRVTDDVKDGELLKEFELARQKYKARKQQVGSRQKDTLARLAAFTGKLRSAPAPKQAQQQQQQQADAAAAQAAADEAAAAAAAKQRAADDAAAVEAAAASAAAAAEAAAAAAKQADEAYDGKVRTDIDHKAYMPAAWRVDEYLNQQSDDEDDLASLRQHRLQFSKAPGDAMARSDNLDDYVVFDPLLEKGKGKFSRAAQKEKKKGTAWAGRGHG